MPKQITYKDSGVDIDTADRLVDKIKILTKSTHRKEVKGGIGGFSGAFALPRGVRNPLLLASTDGVGTKLMVAKYQKRHDTIGIDLVAMCVNDLICCGGEPLFFLDYYAMGKLKLNESVQILKGIVKGCQESNCALLGGETAEMPGMYHNDDYDLAGFSVGIIDSKKIIDGKRVVSGDVVIGLHSSGLHSNGFSLARKVFSKKELGGKWGKTLLIPTKIYVKPVLSLVKLGFVKAAAHITGGGFTENIPRALPKNKNVVINKGSWKIPGIFFEIQKRGNIAEKEMYRTFNMGIGMTLIVSKKNLSKTTSLLKRSKTPFSVIGTVTPGKGKVIFD